jgi:hypothetical protein
MGLIVRMVSVRPVMPGKGGTVNFVFEAQSTGATTAEKTSYSIPADAPYVFTNPTDPAKPRVFSGERREVTIIPGNRSTALTLRKVDGPSVARVFVNADVFEVDANGDPLRNSGVARPPKPLTGVVTIE